MLTWDENKRTTNLRKHGIDFADLESVFGNYMHSEKDTSCLGEVRIKSLCWLNGVVLHLVWVEQQETARLISCRRATKHEARTYFENAFFYQRTN